MEYVSCQPPWRPYVTGDWECIKIFRSSCASWVNTKPKPCKWRRGWDGCNYRRKSLCLKRWINQENTSPIDCVFDVFGWIWSSIDLSTFTVFRKPYLYYGYSDQPTDLSWFWTSTERQSTYPFWVSPIVVVPAMFTAISWALPKRPKRKQCYCIMLEKKPVMCSKL